jgi:hypothetical protein
VRRAIDRSLESGATFTRGEGTVFANQRRTPSGIHRPAILLCMLCGATLGAQGIAAAPMRQNLFPQQQIPALVWQINQFQLQSVNLTLQIADLSAELQAEVPAAVVPTPPANAPPEPVESPELKAARLAADDAKKACDNLKQKLLAAGHDMPEYTQAQAALASARADLASAREQASGPSHEVVALANKVLADETILSRLDRQTLEASPDCKAADAKLQQATSALARLRTNPDGAVKANTNAPAVVGLPIHAQQLQAQIRDLTAQRDRADAQGQALMRQLASLSPATAQLVAQEGEGIREEQTQLRQQQQANLPKSAAGAPLITFSPQVPQQVRTFLQGNLDEMQRMKDPAYAAMKQQQEQQRQQALDEQSRQQAQRDQEQAERDRQQQQQQQDDQQRQQQQEDQQRQAAEQARQQQEDADRQQQQQQEQQAQQQAQQQQQQQQQQDQQQQEERKRAEDRDRDDQRRRDEEKK